jgi:putative hemolysin
LISGSSIAVFLLLCLLALAAYLDRIYFEMGKFLSREYTENIDAWENWVEPKLKLSRESSAMSASVLRQVALGALVFLLAIRLQGSVGHRPAEIVRTVFELVLVLYEDPGIVDRAAGYSDTDSVLSGAAAYVDD